jgi:hypothetical protein
LLVIQEAGFAGLFLFNHRYTRHACGVSARPGVKNVLFPVTICTQQILPILLEKQTTRVDGADMALKVIGTGFGRTGTMSLKAALEQLGFDPCYHMVECFPKGPKHWDLWTAALNNSPNWDAIFQSWLLDGR